VLTFESHDPARAGELPTQVSLVFHGLRICISGDWLEVIEGLRQDFAWFEVEGTDPPGIAVNIERRAPDFGAAGDLVASFVTPRNVVYQHCDRALIDYFGKVLSRYDRRDERLVVQGEDHDLVHEAAYQFILSRVGAHLDELGLPRLHALGLSGRDGAVAVLLPSGGGKSTLALSALRADGVSLLSEDSPLIDRHGLLHPFPLRLGVNAGDAHRLPLGATRTVNRMEFAPKTLLGLGAFADRIEAAPRPLRHLVVGQRTLGTHASLEPIGRAGLIGPLLRECVVGVGLYQGMEFILQRGLRDVTGKLGQAKVRVRCSAAAVARAQTWNLRLGRDHEANWRALSQLFD
jgi:hypothetical protein